MKTVVFGLFDDAEAAQQVLAQLARSPLDLDAVAVVHADPDVQRRMAADAGLPDRRSVLVGLALGAVVGGIVGAWLGTDILASLGPLLAAAAGVLAGGALGGFFAALNESLRLPPEHAEALSKAVDEGATVILVRSPSMPTARAIRDLFVVGGSVEMSSAFPPASAGGLVPVTDPPSAPEDSHAYEQPAALAPSDSDRPSGPGDEHAMFAPPWRRSPASVRVPPGVSAVMDAEEQAHNEPAGETSADPSVEPDLTDDVSPAEPTQDDPPAS